MESAKTVTWLDCETTMEEFSPEAVIDHWWDAKIRKPSHCPRKKYKKHAPHVRASENASSGTDSSEEEENVEESLPLDDWDAWIMQHDD